MNTELAIDLTKKSHIINVKTGEAIAIKDATNGEISEFLTKINWERRNLDKLEKKIKAYIKKNRLGDWDGWEEGLAFGNHRITRTFRKSFDKTKFEKQGSEEEKSILDRAEKIKEKYTLLTEIITIK